MTSAPRSLAADPVPAPAIPADSPPAAASEAPAEPTPLRAVTREAVEVAAAAIWEKKGFDVLALHVGPIAQYTDVLLIASATSDRHAVAVADHVEAQLSATLNMKPFGVEGRAHGRWIVIDYSDFVVHVFQRAVRAYYELDRLYADAAHVALEEPAWLAETSPDALEEQAFDVGEQLWNGAVAEESDAESDAESDTESDQ